MGHGLIRDLAQSGAKREGESHHPTPLCREGCRSVECSLELPNILVLGGLPNILVLGGLPNILVLGGIGTLLPKN